MPNDELDMLRSLSFELSTGARYRLDLWDTHQVDRRGKTIIGYRLAGAQGVVFEGADIAASPLHADDSDETVRALVTFLTLRPGDTDRDYFAEYTPLQWDFVNSDADELGQLAEEQLVEIDDEGAGDQDEVEKLHALGPRPAVVDLGPAGDAVTHEIAMNEEGPPFVRIGQSLVKALQDNGARLSMFRYFTEARPVAVGVVFEECAGLVELARTAVGNPSRASVNLVQSATDLVEAITGHVDEDADEVVWVRRVFRGQ